MSEQNLCKHGQGPGRRPRHLTLYLVRAHSDVDCKLCQFRKGFLESLTPAQRAEEEKRVEEGNRRLKDNPVLPAIPPIAYPQPAYRQPGGLHTAGSSQQAA